MVHRHPKQDDAIGVNFDAMANDLTLWNFVLLLIRIIFSVHGTGIRYSPESIPKIRREESDHRQGMAESPLEHWQYVKQLKTEASDQLRAYFKGTLKDFSLPLDLDGTPFQLKVWNALQKIPYGTTISYGELARWIGKPKAVRAVGGANGRNPIPLVVPCHRVIGSDGSLTGYGSGLPIKSALLEHERKVSMKN